VHTNTQPLAHLHAQPCNNTHTHPIISPHTPLHQYMHTLALTHTVPKNTYTMEMPNITPSHLKHLAQKVREWQLKLMQRLPRGIF